MGTSKIWVQGMRVIGILLLLSFTGCSSSYKDFKVSNVDEDEGIAIGKVEVTYNNSPYNTDLCKFCIGYTCHKLLKEGYVFMSLKRNEDHSVLSLLCHYIGGQGDRKHKFKISSINLNPGINYIGNLLFTAKEVSPNQLELGMILPQEAIKYDVSIEGIPVGLLIPEGPPVDVVGAKLSIRDELADVLEVFRKQVEKEDIQVEKNLIDIK